MKKRNLMKFLSLILAATLCLQPAMSTTVFAEELNEDVVIEEVVDVVEEEEVVVNDEAVTVEPEVTEEAEVSEEVSFLQDATVSIPTEATKEEVQALLAEAVVVDPSTVDAQALVWEYQCEGKDKTGLGKNTAWGSIYGFTSSKKVGLITSTYTHPALTANEDGSYNLRCQGSDEVITLTKMSYDSSIVLNEGVTVAIDYNEDATIDFAALEQKVFDQVVASTTPELTREDVTIEYYASPKITVAGLGAKFVPFAGKKETLGEFPAISEGTQRVKVSFAGKGVYKAASAEVEVTFTDRAESEIILKEGPFEIGMSYGDENEFDLAALKTKIFNEVVESTTPELTASDVTMKYNAGTANLKNWKEFDAKDATNFLNQFGLGEKLIQISWAGNADYKATAVEVKVNFTDQRVESEIALVEGATISYNMDAYQMKKAIFNNVIDWTNSSLPSKDEISIDDFTFEYYGENTLGAINGGVKQWAPIEGGTVTLLTYPQMSAGEQKIRVSYKGNDEFRPSEKKEASITVKKAKVSVKVKSTSINVGDPLPADFITTNPADTFDKYVVYSGLSSDLQLTIYMQLPEKFTDSAVLKLLDPIAKAINGKTFTEMINEGMTVGELKEFFNAEALIKILDTLNIDLGTLGQVIQVIDKLPSVADNVRIAFGTPNRAGLYNVTVVTDNKNYETGIGTGTLLVKMRGKGTKLNWNETIPGNKLTASQAVDFDFGVTLSYDGDVTVSQKGVKYLYSGFTSKWRIYSSTSKAPTEPGSYVQTVVTIGGNYIAAPVTRTFKITK